LQIKNEEIEEKMKTVYFDNGSTTMMDPNVAKKVEEYNALFYGNASSIHHKGREAKKILEEARKIIAESINASPKEIIFTSGGTESNNLAIKGIAFAKGPGKHIITTKIEHDCVLNSCKWLENQGYEISYLDVDENGFVDIEQLKNTIKKNTILVSIIHGNNEIGTIQDLKKIYDICKKNNVYFHTDACQSYTKTELNSDHADLITLNSHKIHGPKGVGALFIKSGIKLTPLLHGGGHERNIRSGTENVPAIAGFGEAVKIALQNNKKELMVKYRDILIENILKIPHTRLNGPISEERLCNNANFSFKGIEGESIIGYLDIEGICASSGSACSSHSLEASHVLTAIGLNHEEAHGSLRLTISRFTTEEEINFVLDKIPNVIKKLRNLSPISEDN
jgi:cysteine desulfurase